MKMLSSEYMSVLSRELGLLLRTGLTCNDSLAMLRDNEDDKKSKALLDLLYKSCENGLTLSEAMEDSGVFPQYMLGVVRLGELSNKLDDALSSLSEYYNDRSQLSRGVRSAVFYPIVLLSVMISVIIVLLSQVLPIFNTVYAQMGTEISGLAAALIGFGKALSSASVIIASAFAVILLGIVLLYKIPHLRRAVIGKYVCHYGSKSVLGQISAVKFASALSMAVSSGLDAEQAIFIAGEICRSSPGMCSRMAECRQYLDSGESLENCLSKARIFSTADSRALTMVDGNEIAESIMVETARRSEKKIIEKLDVKLKKTEPFLVLITSLIIGLMLLSVMLPLVGIMSSIS